MKEVPWSKVSQFEGPERSPGFLLWQVSTSWRRQIEGVLAVLGLTHPQFVLLSSVGWLTRNHSEVSQADLARHCRLDITMTSQVLRTLEKRGLIERRKREGDERSKFPRLTKRGAALVAQAIPLVEGIDHLFFDRLGSDLAKCTEILRNLS